MGVWGTRLLLLQGKAASDSINHFMFIWRNVSVASNCCELLFFPVAVLNWFKET